MSGEPDDESSDYGRYNKPDSVATGEDELWSIILDLVEQSCGVKDDELDSSAISACERAIIALDEAGFVKIEPGGRIVAKILPKARKFQKWIEIKVERPRRIAEARHSLTTVPGQKPETVARIYDITVEELIGEPTGREQS